ncbi:MAG: hypothetical protein ACK41T_03660 [Pseudobdellovibrio sp.]
MSAKQATTPQFSPDEIKAYKNNLPHLFGFKFFKWSREFWESTNRYTFLTLSNQSGKSIISIRKSIRLATDTDLWKKVFKGKPSYGLYFYPTLKLATLEFQNKWVTQLLPRGPMKDDPKYGWRAEYKDGEIYCIHFNIGTKIYFLSYATQISALQAMSPHWVSADEEMPQALWGEVSARLMATKGLFSLVCTPTLGEELWRGVFELNKMPNAKVIKGTMYDTVTFEDGSEGLRTVEEIEDFKAKLSTQREIDIRVYAKFTKAEGLIFPTFDPQALVVPPLEEARSWPVYAAVDVGSGGLAHPAAITFIAVRPDMKVGRVIKTWRGDKTQNTSSVDILRKYQELKVGLMVIQAYYDYQSKEFAIHAQNNNEPFLRAEKSHELGESKLNTLFKHGILLIEADESPEMLNPEGRYHYETLVEEILFLKKETKKTKAKDDQTDSLRYAAVNIPFDLTHIGVSTVVKGADVIIKPQIERVQYLTKNINTYIDYIDEEIEFWNELL